MPDNLMQNTFNTYGTFSTPSFGGVGEPYTDKRPADSRVKGKQFTTNQPRRGQTGDNWNRGTGRKADWNVLFEGEKYADPHTADRKSKNEERAKHLTPDGFKYTSPSKKNTGLGNYYGTIGAKFSHEPEYNVLNKEMKPPAVAPQPRQMLTSPMKRGSHLTPGIAFGPPPTADGVRKKEYFHLTDEYNRAHAAEQAQRKHHEEMRGGRPPFRAMSRSLDFFDSHKSVAASKVYTEDPPVPARELKSANSSPKPAVPFYPSRAPRSGRLGTFEPFPKYQEDPLEEKLKQAREAAAASKISGPAFRPTSKPKSTRTQSILFRQPGVSL
uniref:Cilia-and flagella-associated protein 96 n=1 Tax=Chrysotila carterae TaxID=13221 RepID=A0A7S4C2H8_CHRCT|mmetsp:Transcript_11517/g.24684  ORF Transcript_11517/g.24684 Transcript_11517/m.24684 type:complete len:326 (+) Transcript_11517:175-1152(+)